MHTTPSRLVTKRMRWTTGPQLVVTHGAGGEQLKHYGCVEILMSAGRKPTRACLEAMEARRALLSVSATLDAGW